MRKSELGMPNTRHYKLGALEQALVTLRHFVCRPHDLEPIRLSPVQAMMLLEAARLGAGKLYKSLDPLKDISSYPMP
jgi:hypothetical protein